MGRPLVTMHGDLLAAKIIQLTQSIHRKWEFKNEEQRLSRLLQNMKLLIRMAMDYTI